jgi:hypothetical protein
VSIQQFRDARHERDSTKLEYLSLVGLRSKTSLAVWARIEPSLATDNSVMPFTLVVLVVAALAFGLAPLRAALSLNRV